MIVLIETLSILAESRAAIESERTLPVGKYYPIGRLLANRLEESAEENLWNQMLSPNPRCERQYLPIPPVTWQSRLHETEMMGSSARCPSGSSFARITSFYT